MVGRAARGLFFGRDRLARVSVVATVLAVIGLTVWRLFYGVDFTDESFYVVLPYRLVLGSRPFVDETSVTQQTAAILLYPFVRVYRAVAGVTGIVLFVRCLQFAFSLAVAAAVVAGLRGVVELRRAVLVSLAAIAFVPFDIHSLSYNTLGGGLFTAGCLLGFRSVLVPSRAAGRLAGLCHGLAAFAYPPLLVAVAAAWVARVVVSPARGRRRAVATGLPALVLPVAGMVALVAAAGLHVVVADYRRSSQFLGQGGGVGKLTAIATHEWKTLPFWYLLLPALALLATMWRRYPSVASWLVLALPVLVLPPKLTFYSASLEYVAHYGWLALPLVGLVRRHVGARELFAVVWLPALLAGLTTAYSSANGGTNFGVGFFPATVVTSIFLLWALERPLHRRFRVPAATPLVAVAAFLALFEAIPVYRDGAVSTLSARVENGPYAGLLTSRRKLAFLDQLGHDLAWAGPTCRIVFFNDFPAGYLLTSTRPDTNAAWIETVAPNHVASYQRILLAYYRRRTFPDVVVEMRRIPYAPPGSARIERYHPSEPLLAALRERSYKDRVSRLDYVVYSRPSAACGSSR